MKFPGIFFAHQCAILEEISPLRILREFSRVARRTWRNLLEVSSLPFKSLAYSHLPCLLCQSSSHSYFLVIVYASSPTGNFEDFKVLGALLQLSIGGCKKIDFKKALAKVLPTMPWAAQIQKLDLGGTDVEGTAECSFVFGAPVRFFWKNFLVENLARTFSSGSQNLKKVPGFFFAPFELYPCLSLSHTHTHTLFFYLNLTLFC